MKNKKKIPTLTKMTLESLDELTECFQKGKPFKCGSFIMRPSKDKEEFACCACWSCKMMNAKNKMKRDVRKFICEACNRADANANYNYYHYLEM